MLSEYVPLWLIGVISPAITFITGKVPATLKPVIMFGISMMVIIYTVLMSPLGWESLIEQTIILFGMVAGGYTAAKGVDTLAKKAGPAVIAIGLLGLGAAVVNAQPPTEGGATVDVQAPPVATTVSVWAQWGLALLGGIIGRAIKRLPW